MRSLISRTLIQARLGLIFPRSAYDPVLSNPLAASALAAMLYIDAVVPDIGDLPDGVVWARPSLCLWMSDAVYAREGNVERIAWRIAVLGSGGRRAMEELQASWGLTDAVSWYRDNSRETLRDETFAAWLRHGAIRSRPGIPSTSSKPRWALSGSFASLFDPSLDDGHLAQEIDAWRESHMAPGDRFRIQVLRSREQAAYALTVTLPDGRKRYLEPGTASEILRGVIEQWAPARLRDPVVLTISEPGDKVYVADAEQLKMLGLTIDVATLLPDAVIVDIGDTPPAFWIVEAVATDGPVTEDRRRELLRWATNQRIPPASCKFLSAFLDRNDGAARRRLKDLAAGTYAWYSTEPGHELAWYEVTRED
jgi:hypothetical protein